MSPRKLFPIHSAVPTLLHLVCVALVSDKVLRYGVTCCDVKRVSVQFNHCAYICQVYA